MRHFYYFSTPLKRWYMFKNRVWPGMPQAAEHQLLCVIDTLLTWSGRGKWWSTNKHSPAGHDENFRSLVNPAVKADIPPPGTHPSAPDLNDMDRVHRNAASGGLVDTLVQLAGRDPDC
jgi:hypothetical protein